MNKNKQKGTRFESEVVQYLQQNGHPEAERVVQHGALDCGDIRMWAWVLEAKATKELDIAGAVDESQAELANAEEAYQEIADWAAGQVGVEVHRVGPKWGAAIIKRRRKHVAQAYVVMPLEQFARLTKT